MPKIVDMQHQLQRKKKKELLEKHRGMVETVQKIVQCSSCHLRCAMCGMQLDKSCVVTSVPGLSFCEGCRLDFEEYRDVLAGKKEPEVFWHNTEWLNVWGSWLNYRRALSAFTNSREFKRLTEEVNRES